MQWAALYVSKDTFDKMQQWEWNELTKGFLCCAISRDNVSQANSLNRTTNAIHNSVTSLHLKTNKKHAKISPCFKANI